jgi:hypothetical protein
MQRVIELVGDHVRLTMTNDDGISVAEDMSLEEAVEYGRQLIAFADKLWERGKAIAAQKLEPRQG